MCLSTFYDLNSGFLYCWEVFSQWIYSLALGKSHNWFIYNSYFLKSWRSETPIFLSMWVLCGEWEFILLHNFAFCIYSLINTFLHGQDVLDCKSLCVFYSLVLQWHPTPVLLPGKSHGWRSLVGCSPWGRYQSDTTERLHFDFSLSCIGEGNGNPLLCSCLENPRDEGAWWAAVYGVAQSVGHNWSDLAAAAALGFRLSLPIHYFPLLPDLEK